MTEKVLRASAYLTMHGPPVTVVLRESDLECPVEEALAAVQAPGGDALVTHEIFDYDGDIVAATIEGERRHAERAERDAQMAILYHYDGDALASVTERGLLTGTLPAPLSADEIAKTFEQLANHSNYRRQVVKMEAEDGVIVTLDDGEITRSVPEEVV